MVGWGGEGAEGCTVYAGGVRPQIGGCGVEVSGHSAGAPVCRGAGEQRGFAPQAATGGIGVCQTAGPREKWQRTDSSPPPPRPGTSGCGAAAWRLAARRFAAARTPRCQTAAYCPARKAPVALTLAPVILASPRTCSQIDATCANMRYYWATPILRRKLVRFSQF